jgi:hypothetical protein
MKTRIITLAILILSCIYSFAQESSLPSYSQDIGFNTAFIFEGIFNSETTPFTLMYKKYVSENKANRFGIDLSMSMNNAESQGSSSYSETSYASLRLNIGREIQKAITEKWIWFYGGDLVPFYSFYDNDNYQNEVLYSNDESSSLGLTLRPFLAIRYNITPRLYLSAEASLNLSYTLTEQLQELPQSNQVTRDLKTSNFTFDARAANGLFLFYRF